MEKNTVDTIELFFKLSGVNAFLFFEDKNRLLITMLYFFLRKMFKKDNNFATSSNH